MNDHLPECYQSEGKWGGGCICVRLRACEQRTLDAAREAVAALPPIVTEDPVVSPDGELGWRERLMTWICNKDHALAAIDALKEKP